MVDLPDPLAEYLETAVVATRYPAWLHVARDGRLIESGGPLGMYGVGSIAVGDSVVVGVPVLEGLLPLDEITELPCVAMGSRLPADIHLIPGVDSDWILLLDASSEAILRGLVQQRTNDLSLLRARHDALDHGPPEIRDVPSTLAAVLGALVIEEEPSGDLIAIGRAPNWLGRFLDAATLSSGADVVSRFAFLEAFLADAREFWARNTGPLLEGGTWEETDAHGTDACLEAVAASVEGRRFLVVRHVDESRDERKRVIQRARELSLDLDRMQRELQQKEVLFHCLVHDLAGPLTSIKAIFSMLEREELPESMARLVGIGVRQTSRQEELIQDMLAVYAAERRVFDPATFDRTSAPDAVICIRVVVDALVPAGRAKGVLVEIDFGAESCEDGIRVIGDRLMLERVISNLVENAIRHSPEGGRIRVGIARKETDLQIEVDDEGPGIDEATSASLFRSLSQGSGQRGKVGLGLYFVRITVERWGGKVGFSARTEGGSRFWFTLPVVG